MKNKVPLFWISVLSLSFITIGCSDVGQTMNQQRDMKIEQAETMMERTPVPKFVKSLDRIYISERLYMTNEPENIEWIYLVSNGRIYTRFPLTGKLMSSDKGLTTNYDVWNGAQIETPDEMGTYGMTAPSIFWLCPEGNLHQHNGEYTVLPFPYQIDQTTGSINTNIIDQAEEAKRSAYQTQAKDWLFHERILQNYRAVFSETRNIAEKIVKLVYEVKVLKAKNSGDPEEWQGYDKNRFNYIVTEVKEQEQQYQRLVDWYNQNAKGYDKSLFVNKHLPYEIAIRLHKIGGLLEAM